MLGCAPVTTAGPNRVELNTPDPVWCLREKSSKGDACSGKGKGRRSRPLFDSRQHEARTLKEHFSVSQTFRVMAYWPTGLPVSRIGPSRVESGRSRSGSGQSSPFSVLPSPVGTRLVGEARRGEVRFGHACLRYMANTVTLCLSDKRMHVQVRAHEAGAGAGAGASCQGLLLLLLLRPSHLLPKTVPSCYQVRPCSSPPLPACPPAAHLPASEPEPYPSLSNPPKPARELKPGPPATLVRCTHTSLSLLSIISITINRSAPLTCTPIASHHRTHICYRVHANANTWLPYNSPASISCPAYLTVSFLVPLPSRCRGCIRSRHSKKARLRRPPSSLCFEVHPASCLLLLRSIHRRHPTDGLHLRLDSPFPPRPSELGLPLSGPSPSPLQSSKYSSPSALDPAVYSYLYPPPLFRIFSCSFPH